MEGKDLPGQLVLVTWTDAHADVDGWIDVEDIEDEPCLVYSVGMMLDDPKTGHLSLAQSVTHGRIDSVIHIPRKMVVAVENLEPKNASTSTYPLPDRLLPEARDPQRL